MAKKSKPPLVTTPKPFVFVLMPFSADFDDIYKFGIRGAAEDTGAYAERLDEQIFTEGMLERIFNQIAKADVVVADMTGRNANVFYEVGYAHALGKTVLLITQQADAIPFDLKHKQHIVYGGKISDLRPQLAKSLRWAIAESKRSEPEATLSVFLGDLRLPEAGSAEPPIYAANFSMGHDLAVPFEIRNTSLTDIFPGATHLYLLTRMPSKIRPIYLDRGTSGKEEKDFPAAYRLPMAIPPIPPGAFELISINFKLGLSSKIIGETSSLFKLRMHAGKRIYEFCFGLRRSS